MIMKKFLPILVITGFALVVFFIVYNPPEAKRRTTPEPTEITIDVQELQLKPYSVKLSSYGSVRPRIRSELISQVSGKVILVNEDFRDGGFFEKGELLLKIDPADYEAEFKVAQASLVSARQALLEEQARADVARGEWNKIGSKSLASELALRKPQLEAAHANVESAEAALQLAKLNLKRTEIRAPYAGRILKKHVDFGQVIPTNKTLAEIYAIDVVEIRLPLKNQDLKYINLPENLPGKKVDKASLPAVTIYSTLVNNQQWSGRIVRTEGAIDDTSQQLHVIAQIENPFVTNGEQLYPLKIGQYVTAEIEGRQLGSALVIPNSSIYQGSYVYTVQKNLLQRKEISIAWQNDNEAIISDGLQPEDALVLTPLGRVTSGTRVAISSENERKRHVAKKNEIESNKNNPGNPTTTQETVQ